MMPLLPDIVHGHPVVLAADVSDILYIIFGIVYVIGQLVIKQLRKRQQPPEVESDEPVVQPEPAAPRPVAEPIAPPREPPRRPSPVTPAPVDRSARAGSADRAAIERLAGELESRLTRVRGRFAAILMGWRGRAATTALAGAAANRIAPKLEAVEQDIGNTEGRRAGSSEGIRRQLGRVAATLDSIEAFVGVLEEVARERETSEDALQLADLDAFVARLLAPVLKHADRRRTVLVIEQPASARQGQPLLAADFLPVFVGPGFRRDVRGWGRLGFELGRATFAVDPGLADRVRQELGLPSYGQLPRMTSALTVSDLHGLVAAWYPTLYADLAGAVMLGTAYLRHLVAELPADGEEDGGLSVTAAHVEGRGRPPAIVRLATVHATLRELGYSGDLDAVWASWLEARENPTAVPLETLTGGVLSVPLEPLSGYLGSVGVALVRVPTRALGGVSLLDHPRIALSPAGEGELVAQERRIISGEPLKTPPGATLAASIGLATKAPSIGRTLGPRLLDAYFRGEGGAHPWRARRSRAAARGEMDFRPSPELLVDAMIFNSIFRES